MKKKNLVFLLCSLFLVCASCDDEVNNDSFDVNTAVTVKITGSANLVINTVAITTGTGETQSYSDLGTGTWTRNVSYKKAIAVSAGGSTTNGENGSLKIQITSGNQVLKESVAEGKKPTTTASYYN